MTLPVKIIYSIGSSDVEIRDKFITKFYYSADLFGSTNKHYIQFVDPQRNVIENLYIFGGESIKFSFGYENRLSQQHVATIYKYSPIFKQTGGGIVDIIAVDNTLKISRGVKNRSFMNLSRSDIVTQIALEHGFKTDIEPTIGFDNFIQLWKNDIKFLKEDILPGSVSINTGRGDYYLYIQGGNTIVYKTPDYTQNIYARYEVDNNPNVIAFNPSFCPDLSLNGGGEGLLGFGYDPINKLPLSTTIDNELTPEKEITGKRTAQIDKPLFTNERTLITARDDLFELNNQIKHRYYTSLQVRYMAELIIIGDPHIEIGNIIEIIINTQFKGLHYASGKYLVHGVSHMIENGRYNTKLLLTKNSSIVGDTIMNGVYRSPKFSTDGLDKNKFSNNKNDKTIIKVSERI